MSPCGHEIEHKAAFGGIRPEDLDHAVEIFVGRESVILPCLKCRDWLRRNKEAVLAAEHLNRE
jgi:hypothetical protein